MLHIEPKLAFKEAGIFDFQFRVEALPEAELVQFPECMPVQVKCIAGWLKLRDVVCACSRVRAGAL